MQEQIMAKVTSPNSNFNGERLGVQFNKGKAECSEQKAKELNSNFGYEFEILTEQPPAEKTKKKPGGDA